MYGGHQHQQHQQQQQQQQFANSQTLWIGDLEPYMDEDAVRRLFGADVQPYLIAVKLIKKDGRFAGYGFLDFSSREAAQQVLTNYSGRPIAALPNKVYRLNWASGHVTGGTGQAAKQLAGNTGSDLYSVFVGDLSQEVTDYILLTTFQQRYASVKGAKVIMDPNTNQSKGFGFVKFSEESDMIRAMDEMNGQYVGSRPVKVAPASNSKKPSGGGGGGGGGGSFGGQYSQYGGGGASSYQHHPQQQQQQQQQQFYQQSQQHYQQQSYGASRQDSSNDSGNTTIYVGNLDGNTTDENILRHTFSIYGPIISVKIPSNNRHCGFVQFADRTQAERALNEMNGARIQGNVVRVGWSKQGSKHAAKGHQQHQSSQYQQHQYQQQRHHNIVPHHQQHQQQHPYQSSIVQPVVTATSPYTSISPVPVATAAAAAAIIPTTQAPSPVSQVITPGATASATTGTAAAQQTQQQQYAAYYQWQQQMMAYNNQVESSQTAPVSQQTTGDKALSTSGATAAAAATSVVVSYEKNQDHLPTDYFTKPFNVQRENESFIESYGTVFTSSCLAMDFT